MSSLCPASYNILVLRDEDLGSLNDSHLHSNPGKILVERRIDIQLACNFISDFRGGDYEIEVKAWKDGTTDVCGSCSFCNLLADSISRGVETALLSVLLTSSDYNPNIVSGASKIEGTIHFEQLEYQMDRSRHMADEFCHCGVHLLVLSGYLVPHLKNMDSSMDSMKVAIDLAFELFGEKDDPVVKALNIHRRPLPEAFLSERNVAKIHEWIKDCDVNHGRCWSEPKVLDNAVPAGENTFLPSRIIDVGDASSNKHPRLVITSELLSRASNDKMTKYMALSYCWGPVNETSKLLTTTHDTIGSRIKKIDMHTMPQTFQDAIIMARTLMIQYVWIDSLCIIQDDARDWELESSKMASIFSNAYLTLSAASGSGCNDGFLDNGPPRPTCTIPLYLKSDKAMEGQFSLRFRRGRGRSDKMANIIAGKWVTRGWTFQEERLARRILIFGENKFFFDCRTLEQSQDTERFDLRPGWARAVTIGPRENTFANPEKAEVGKRWDYWQTLCTHYSYRELTFQGDKLPAISGMASKIAEKVQSDYLAGLWKDNLAHDLFWQTVSHATKAKKYRAPSWSWTSLDGRIEWPLWPTFISCGGCSMFCTIMDANTTPVGLDPFGAVKAGYLKIRGVLVGVELVLVEFSMPYGAWRLCFQGQAIGSAKLDTGSTLLPADVQKSGYHALLIAECLSREESKTSIRGLLLERNDISRENHEEFQRVGTFTLDPEIKLSSHSTWYSETEREIIIV